MSDKDTTDTAEPIEADPATTQDVAEAGAEVGADQVQAAFDEAAEKGYFGETPETKPNEAFTVKGSIKAAKEAGNA